MSLAGFAGSATILPRSHRPKQREAARAQDRAASSPRRSAGQLAVAVEPRRQRRTEHVFCLGNMPSHRQ